MPRFKLFIEYDGTAYSGWQKQPDAATVEGEIEKALSQILRQSIDVIGQGRTDSGVHAEAQVVHFDYPQPIDQDDLLYALLGVLPRDISVWEMQHVSDDFHARFDAGSRQYRYQIVTRPSPLLNRVAKFIPYNLNQPKMQECAGYIVGTHDFRNFCKTSDQPKGTACDIKHSAFEFNNKHRITYRIRANRFVHHMVRRLVGTMVQVGKGKRSVSQFREMINQPENNQTAHGIAAKGLILEKVEY